MKIPKKSYLFITLLLITQTDSFSQPKTGSVDTFKKETNSTNTKYYLEDVVMITDGRGEQIKVKFKAVIPIEVWDNNVRQSRMDDKEFFNSVADHLSGEAQESLKNPLSFSPFSREAFEWSGDRFTCEYQMTGKNGYGNDKETSILVSYVPNTNPLDVPLPKRHSN